MIRIKECDNVYVLAARLNVSTASITNILYNIKTENCYKKFVIPKKNGESRIIYSPCSELKSIQRRLANALYDELRLIREEEHINPKISHAFEKKKSIISNCEIHKNKRFILNIDLEKFFDHFHFGRVYGYFLKNKHFLCTNETARTIANISCYQGKLPQGAPTSPIITNLIFQAVDARIIHLTKKYRLDYTRYADDLTFSTNRCDFTKIVEEFLNKLNKILNRSGFEINQDKTRWSYCDSRQTVTGLVVNKKINISNDYYKLVRAYANSYYKSGSFQIKNNDGKIIKSGTINQLEGMLSFIHMVDRHNRDVLVLQDQFQQQRSLNKREREYQRFIFFKYFYKNDRPLIITEGKTDPIYICCALKKNYLLFPELIEKTDLGFEFKIQFMKKSKRMHEMFSFVKDGASAMTTLYKNFFKKSTKNVFPDYYQYFFNITNKPASKPVIFIFDNETENKDKPLCSFINQFKNEKNAMISKIQKDGWIRIIPDRNLYIVTNPLVDSKSECEIEELFSNETQEQIINGKTFTLESDFDTDKHFGKDIFSKVIARDYEKINFDQFIPFLERIQEAINNYYNSIK